jgi:hypothetical protein
MFDKKLQKRLEYYGITKGGNIYLYQTKIDKYDYQIDIKYLNKVIYNFYIVKA